MSINKDICNFEEVELLVKLAPNITLNTDDFVYGESKTFNVTISNMESGNITYTIKNSTSIIKEVTKEFSDNSSSILLENLEGGNYTVSVTILETEECGSTTVSKAFTVKKADSTIQLSNNTIVAIKDCSQVGFLFYITDSFTNNGIETLSAILPRNTTGYLTFKINNTSITKTIGRDVVKVLFDNLDSGTYTVFVTYSGDNNYKTSEEYNFTLENLRLTPELSLNFTNITYGELFNVNATVNTNVNNNVTFIVCDVEGNVVDTIVKQLNDNFVSASFNKLSAGNYIISATYGGDSTYAYYTVSNAFKVNRSDLTTFTLKVNKTTVLDNIKVEALIPVNVSGSVTFRLNGLDMTVDLSNNQLKLFSRA